MYDTDGRILSGRPIGSSGRKYNTYTAANCFDNDPLTFFEDARYGSFEKYVGLALEKPTSIKKISILPRNDLNSIQVGDNYELTYWDGKQFQSLGSKIAEDTLLTFNNVPKNALLLLHNHSAGVEERIFTYEGDKQIWW